jgi:hypothetical protein
MLHHQSPVTRGSPTALRSHKKEAPYRLVLGLLLTAAFGTHPVAAEMNLIQNGGFEFDLVEPGAYKLGLGRYGDWISSTPGGCFGSTELLGLPFPHVFGKSPLSAYEGDAGMNLGPCFGGGSVRQSFTTIVGANYKVSLAVIGGTVTASVFNASNIDLSVDFVARESQVWTTDSYTFTATHISSTIMLQNTSPKTNSCCAPTIDDVRVNFIDTATQNSPSSENAQGLDIDLVPDAPPR